MIIKNKFSFAASIISLFIFNLYLITNSNAENYYCDEDENECTAPLGTPVLPCNLIDDGSCICNTDDGTYGAGHCLSNCSDEFDDCGVCGGSNDSLCNSGGTCNDDATSCTCINGYAGTWCQYNDVDNCPNDYNPDQSDSDGDDIGDVCDECHNMAGDVNDDMLVDVLDIVLMINMILNNSYHNLDNPISIDFYQIHSSHLVHNTSYFYTILI